MGFSSISQLRRKTVLRLAIIPMALVALSYLFLRGDNAWAQIRWLQDHPSNPPVRVRTGPGTSPTPRPTPRRSNHGGDDYDSASAIMPGPDPDLNETSAQIDEIEGLLLAGNNARDTGRYDEADRKYRQILNIKRNEWRAYYGLANVLFDRATIDGFINQQIMADAVKEYERAVENSPFDPQLKNEELAELYSDLGEAYLTRNNGEARSKAKDAINKAIELNPRSSSAQRRLGNRYFVERRFEDAIRQYQVALDIAPNDYLNHAALGAAYSEKKRYDDSIKEYKEVVRLSPQSEEAYEYIGDAYVAKRQYAASIEWFRKAAEIAPDNPEPQFKLALSYYNSGDLASAQREAERLYTIDRKRARDLPKALQRR